MTDPIASDSDKYSVIFENERVRVLNYLDAPGASTDPHEHPDSVMITLSSFERRLRQGEQSVDVHLDAHSVRWLDAQSHAGENIGQSATHVIFVELKDRPTGDGGSDAVLGPR